MFSWEFAGHVDPEGFWKVWHGVCFKLKMRRVQPVVNSALAGRRVAQGDTVMNTVACQAFSETTDEELIQRFQGGDDPAAFETLVHRYERELFGYLRRYLHDAEMAEDVFQATFFRIHLKRERFEDGRKLHPRLYTIATHLAIDAQRRNRRHRMATLDRGRPGDDDSSTLASTVVAHESTADEWLEDEETRDWLRSAVEKLPEPQRYVVQLIYQQGLKYREAAQVLGVPVGTVKSRMHSALMALNARWQFSG